jgi:CHASE3 domain sensor protein
MQQLDVKRITTEVAARHGVALKSDDPAMMLVTISEVVLEDCFERLEKRARLLVAELDAAFEDMQQRGASHLSDQARTVASSVREEIGRDIQAAKLDASEAVFKLQQCYSHVVVWRWVAVGLVCGVSLVLLGFAIGRML